MTVAFFAVCDRNHFVAVAAMVSSLREVGHTEPVYVTDCGLTDRQREILAPHVTLIPAAGLPVMLKLHGPAVIRPDVAVLLDADVIVRRSLADLISHAKPVFFLNDVQHRREPYVNSGHMILTRDLIAPFQTGIEEMLAIAAEDPSVYRSPADRFFWPDQDVLNELLASRERDSYVVVDEAAYYPFKRGVKDARLWHHIQPKPWLVPRPQNVYTREMTRLLYDGAFRIPEGMIPVRLRRGRTGDVARAWFAVRYHAAKTVRGKVGLRRRFGKTGSRHFTGARR